MQQVWARHALLPIGWVRDVLVSIDGTGLIADVTPGAPAQGLRTGILLPAPANVHSHAFQRAMAGLTEGRDPSGRDSFWTWRQLMYRFLARLTPADVQAITAFVQMEMLEAGYATHTEFHYLHHQPDGTPYDTLAEMSGRISAATSQSGIGLCLLPVHYQYGGCDGRALSAGQRRFGNDLDRFLALREDAERMLDSLPPDTTCGAAPHSLRAVGQADLRGYADLIPSGPLHMHLAEQSREVADIQEKWGTRPVAWALDNMALNARWCLIHCTQMTSAETAALAKTGAVAGLCPITESNLGDGIFNGVDWLNAGGALAIGSDSNMRISLSEELRTLEYSQRLRDHSRAALATPTQTTGRRLFDAALRGGAQATGRNTGQLAPGFYADMLALNAHDVALEGRWGDALLDTWIFAGDDHLVTDVWSAGRHMVEAGHHIHRRAITDAYRRTLAHLKETL